MHFCFKTTSLKFATPQPLHHLAEMTGARVVGDPEYAATGINEIHRVEPGDLVFVDHPKYYQKALESAATVIIIDQEVTPPEGKHLLVCDAPFLAYNQLVAQFRTPPLRHTGQVPIGEGSEIGEGVQLSPGVVIGNNVHIGNGCILHPNVVLYDDVHLGERVEIHANTTLGSDAFYFNNRKTHYAKMLSGGCVVIEDDVEIGAGCTIDRGVSAVTRVGAGTKLDNLVHLGHDVEVGRRCLIAAQVGVGGTTIISDEVIIWGQVGINKGITIGDKAVLGARAGVHNSLEGGKQYFGAPAVEARSAFRQVAALKQLPELLRKWRGKG